MAIVDAGRTDRRTDGFRQFIDRTCFAIRSKRSYCAETTFPPMDGQTAMVKPVYTPNFVSGG